MRSETNDGYEQAEDDIECGAALTDPLATLHPKIIRLSAEDSVRFVEMLLNPPPMNDAMRRAKESYERLIGSDPQTSTAIHMF